MMDNCVQKVQDENLLIDGTPDLSGDPSLSLHEAVSVPLPKTVARGAALPAVCTKTSAEAAPALTHQLSVGRSQDTDFLVTNRSEKYLARLRAPSTGPMLTEETSFPFFDIEVSSVQHSSEILKKKKTKVFKQKPTAAAAACAPGTGGVNNVHGLENELKVSLKLIEDLKHDHQNKLMKMFEVMNDDEVRIMKLQKELKDAKQKTRLDSHNNVVPSASLDKDWSRLVVQLRQQSSLQVQASQVLLADKNIFIRQLQSENKALKEMIHADNIRHLECQLGGSVSSSDSESSVAAVPKPIRYNSPQPFNPTIVHQDTKQAKVKKSDENPVDITKVEKPVDKNSQWIARMVEVTNKLAKYYAIPEHKRSEASTRRKGGRPAIVPKLFGAIWKLLLAPEKQIFVPDAKPKVDWLNLKTHFKRNLPKAEYFPVQGVSQDPVLYTIPVE